MNFGGGELLSLAERADDFQAVAQRALPAVEKPGGFHGSVSMAVKHRVAQLPICNFPVPMMTHADGSLRATNNPLRL